MSKHTTIVLFRNDLRLEDNPALGAAVARRGSVVPVFVWNGNPRELETPGAASRWWLHHSLTALDQSLRHTGSRLIVRVGNTNDVVKLLATECNATAVYWNRRYEPEAIKADAALRAALNTMPGVAVADFNASLLLEPSTIATQSGKPYTVYTPFSKTCFAAADRIDEPIGAPSRISTPESIRSIAIEHLDLLPKHHWTSGIQAAWQPGEHAAQQRLSEFVDYPIRDYQSARDIPSTSGTSRLSPHLHFGEISIRRVWHTVIAGAPGVLAAAHQRLTNQHTGTAMYLRELLWREFAHHLLFHFPHTIHQPLSDNFERFPWQHNAAHLRAWQRGLTGYPIVDAGMRELWSTGWMHNRVRMVVGSFLVKHLRIDWRNGAAWFWDTLVDADLANNTLGWQWIAGCGADAAPYFRIFNPTLQGSRFDPDGIYIRRWCPELTDLPNRYLFEPWKAPTAALTGTGVKLGQDYPLPIVDHAEARQAALEAFATIKSQSS